MTEEQKYEICKICGWSIHPDGFWVFRGKQRGTPRYSEFVLKENGVAYYWVDCNKLTVQQVLQEALKTIRLSGILIERPMRSRSADKGHVLDFKFTDARPKSAQEIVAISDRVKKLRDALEQLKFFDEKYLQSLAADLSEGLNKNLRDETTRVKGLIVRDETKCYVWRGWEEYLAYWDEFVEQWYVCKEKSEGRIADAACILPDDELTNSIRGCFSAGLTAGPGEMNREELPEPYLGNPYRAKFVIIQMNPGASQVNCNDSTFSLEATKYYSRKDCDGANGFLIKDFADPSTCRKKYSKWIDRWSFVKDKYPPVTGVSDFPLGVNPRLVCGHDWWCAPGRVNWIRSFSDADMNSIFSIEMCPYHSFNFTQGGRLVRDMGDVYLTERILIPAAIAAMQPNGANCIVCCGTVLDKVLVEMGVKKIATWERGLFWDSRSPENVQKIAQWPTTVENRANSRWYRLYQMNLEYVDQVLEKKCSICVPILSMYANQMRMPGKDFRVVEVNIKKRIEELLQDCAHMNSAE